MATARALSVVTAVAGTGIKLGLPDLPNLVSMITDMIDKSFIGIVKIGGGDRRIDEEQILGGTAHRGGDTSPNEVVEF